MSTDFKQAGGIAYFRKRHIMCLRQKCTSFLSTWALPSTPLAVHPMIAWYAVALLPKSIALTGRPSARGWVRQVTEGATAVGLAALLCFLGKLIARALNVPGALIPIATALTVGVATAMPQAVVGLVPSGEGIAAILMQVRAPLASIRLGFPACCRSVSWVITLLH